MPIAERSKSTQVRAEKSKRQEEERIRKLINPATLLTLKQSRLLFLKLLEARIPEPIPALLLMPESSKDNSAEELLLDALIGKAYRDNNILKEPMSIRQVFNSVQGLLSNKKQLYALRTIFDLLLLKQYTVQMLKKEEYYLDKFTASKLVA